MGREMSQGRCPTSLDRDLSRPFSQPRWLLASRWLLLRRESKRETRRRSDCTEKRKGTRESERELARQTTAAPATTLLSRSNQSDHSPLPIPRQRPRRSLPMSLCSRRDREIRDALSERTRAREASMLTRGGTQRKGGTGGKQEKNKETNGK